MIFIVSSLDMVPQILRSLGVSWAEVDRGVEVSSQVATASVEAAKEAMKQLEEPNTVPCRWRMQNSGKTTRILNLHFPREKKDSLQKTKWICMVAIDMYLIEFHGWCIYLKFLVDSYGILVGK